MRTVDSVPHRSRPGEGFTLIELLVVISIIAVLAALIVGLAPKALNARTVNRVKTEMEGLVTVIQSYQSVKGFYPPDNSMDPTRPPLYFELTGTVVEDNSAPVFKDIRGRDLLPADVQNNFGIPGFLNFGPDRQSVKNFHPTMQPAMAKDSNGRQADASGADPIVYLVASAKATNNATINTWRYDSSSPTRHNPESFDLWADILVGGEHVTIKNWKD